MAIFESHPDRITLNQEDILDHWKIVIPEAAGQGEKILEEIEQALKEIGLPDVVTRRKELEIVLEGERWAKAADRRPVLVFHAMKKATYYFSALDFGKHLIVSRFIGRDTPANNSPFAMEEMSAYFSLANSITQGVVKRLTEGNKEFSKINEGSGMIGIT